MIVDLADGGSVDPAELGGKGAALARLIAYGFPVPPGFVVTTAAYARDGPAEPVTRAVLDAYHRLGGGPVAVRSSATAEDLADASFAGQQDSFLEVVGDEPVLDAVRRCWASLHTERAVAYRAERGIGDDGLAMAVVVQAMVAADAAGVLFTVDPVTGDPVTVIDAVPGLADRLVSGEADPDEFRVDRTGAVVDRVRHHPPTLDRDQVTRLVALGGSIAERFDGPMDVEWCRAGDDLFVVQARPITVVAPADPWNDSRAGNFLWTNTNVGEAIPDVMTPVTWSMVQVFLTDAMATASIPPYVGYGRIGGRIYLNVSVMAALSRSVGVSERRFRTLTEEVFGRLPEDLDIPDVPVHRLWVLGSVVPMAVHVLREARRDARRLDGYLAGHPQLCDRRRVEIAATDAPQQLADRWEETLDPEFHRVSLMLSAATRTSGASFVTTRAWLRNLLGDAATNAITSGLGGDAGLASLGLLDGLAALADGAIDRDTFDRQFGHRGPHEFEISIPRPGEDPDWVDPHLAELTASAVDHRRLLVDQEQRRDRAWAELDRRHPRQARGLRRRLTAWARMARNRERARSEVIRYFWVLRAWVIRAGELTGLGEDIFFLERAEILRVLHGETISPRVIAERRAAYAGYRELPAYPTLISGRFDPFRWAGDPRRRSDVVVEGRQTAESAAVRGFAGSAGIVEGVVRVLLDADDPTRLQPGEVLVTTVTNVGWTPLFPRAAAVVTDVGAPLSHAAIVARELGIPAVVGCGNATMLLHTGDRVRVDGGAGTVEVLT